MVPKKFRESHGSVISVHPNPNKKISVKLLGLSVSGLKIIISNQRFTNPKVRGMVINYKEVNNDN